jgi:hypothetical protein
MTTTSSRTRALPAAQVALAIAAALALISAGGPAQAASSARSGSLAPRPPGRQWASLRYDPAQHDVVLFGGNSASQVFGDTWTWTEQGGWAKMRPAAAPSPRTGAAMVYDPAMGQMLLFGGSAKPGTEGGFLNGTWVWNGTTWTRLHPAASPPARHNADMIYDSASREVLMFGGYDGVYLNDTWAWNGSTWTELHPAASPPPRDTFSLVYDPPAKSAIMFGGYNGTALGDTWAWNGSTWTRLHPATSPGITSRAWQAAYDRADRRVVMFGGATTSSGFIDQTWTWTGTDWKQLHPAASPPPRAYGSMTYDGALGRTVLFAGSQGGDGTGPFPRTTWLWTGRTWRLWPQCLREPAGC